MVYRIPDNKPLSKPVSLGSSDSLKLTLTTQEGRTAKRAHQVFLLLTDPETGLDIAYPFSAKDNGKSRLDLVSCSRPALVTVATDVTADSERPPRPVPLHLRTRRCQTTRRIVWHLAIVQ